MRNADELDERRPGLIRERGLTHEHRRIRYAFGGEPPRTGLWATEPAVAPHTDLWVLICGGIAAVAAFAAAFFASGGISHHAVTPTATAVHSVTIAACPTAAPGR